MKLTQAPPPLLKVPLRKTNPALLLDGVLYLFRAGALDLPAPAPVGHAAAAASSPAGKGGKVAKGAKPEGQWSDFLPHPLAIGITYAAGPWRLQLHPTTAPSNLAAVKLTVREVVTGRFRYCLPAPTGLGGQWAAMVGRRRENDRSTTGLRFLAGKRCATHTVQCCCAAVRS